MKLLLLMLIIPFSAQAFVGIPTPLVQPMEVAAAQAVRFFETPTKLRIPDFARREKENYMPPTAPRILPNGGVSNRGWVIPPQTPQIPKKPTLKPEKMIQQAKVTKPAPPRVVAPHVQAPYVDMPEGVPVEFTLLYMADAVEPTPESKQVMAKQTALIKEQKVRRAEVVQFVNLPAGSSFSLADRRMQWVVAELQRQGLTLPPTAVSEVRLLEKTASLKLRLIPTGGK